MSTKLRDPLATARGLGSAKDGVHHWWMQRITAVALVPLVVWFAVSLVMLSGADYNAVREWIARPLVMVMLILTITVGLHHGQLGMQVVYEDYTSGGMRLFLIDLVRGECARAKANNKGKHGPDADRFHCSVDGGPALHIGHDVG